jgi:hypothetical protein
MFIHQILLYHNASGAVRAVTFQRDKVNVITGVSRTGKTAIGRIIDYCLGSGKCSIPVGPIRDTVGWYGLVVEIGDVLSFVARRSPGQDQSSNEFCFVSGPNLAIP